MSEPSPTPPGEAGGIADQLRAAIERTLKATAGSASTTRDRAVELVDEMVRLGREAGDELTRRGQEARDEVARRGHEARDELLGRGQDARDEVARRLEELEARLARLERLLGRKQARAEGEPETPPPSGPGSESEVER